MVHEAVLVCVLVCAASIVTYTYSLPGSCYFVICLFSQYVAKHLPHFILIKQWRKRNAFISSVFDDNNYCLLLELMQLCICFSLNRCFCSLQLFLEILEMTGKFRTAPLRILVNRGEMTLEVNTIEIMFSPILMSFSLQSSIMSCL
jgi:hypothetical protein